MSAPIRTLPADALPTRHTRRYVEPGARRRNFDGRGIRTARGKSAANHAAILANLAEWE
jgi:hypothetical protein